MGLIQPEHEAKKELQEVELLPLKTGGSLFLGDYSNPVMARRAFTMLALAGLRKVSYETIMSDAGGFDIYDMAAGTALGAYSRKRRMAIEMGAVCCTMVQVLELLLFIIQGASKRLESIDWDTYVARAFFGSYAVWYETKNWEVDHSDFGTGWLSFLPEYDDKRLVAGILVNKIAKLLQLYFSCFNLKPSSMSH